MNLQQLDTSIELINQLNLDLLKSKFVRNDSDGLSVREYINYNENNRTTFDPKEKSDNIETLLNGEFHKTLFKEKKGLVLYHIVLEDTFGNDLFITIEYNSLKKIFYLRESECDIINLEYKVGKEENVINSLSFILTYFEKIILHKLEFYNISGNFNFSESFRKSATRNVNIEKIIG